MIDWKEQLGAAFNISDTTQGTAETPSPDDTPRDALEQQGKNVVHVLLDKKGRHGKQATLVVDLLCDDEALKDLARELKTHCGVGGSARDGEILIQGDQRAKVTQFLQQKGFKVK